MKTIKVQLVKSTSTDLMCIVCGQFITDFAIDCGAEPVAGIHRTCIKHAHVQRKTSR